MQPKASFGHFWYKLRQRAKKNGLRKNEGRAECDTVKCSQKQVLGISGINSAREEREMAVERREGGRRVRQ